MPSPLDGVTVLDLSRLLPGPYATLLLSDLGADVIKIEDERGGDYARYFPPLAPDGNSALFHALNRGKRSACVDLKSEAGKALFLNLVRDADVVVESFRPGVMEKLGLSPEALHEVNDQLIVCRISGYGQSGEDALQAGHDINYAARAGVLGMMARPAALPVQVGDLAGGTWPAAFQIVAALYGRSQGQGGATIEVSMTEWVRAMLVMPASRHAIDDEPIGAGTDWLAGSVPCYNVYPTQDGFLSVGALEPKFWMAFCAAVGLEELVGAGLTTGDEGEQAMASITTRLQEKTNAEWEAILRAADCCCEPVVAPEVAQGATAHVVVGDQTLALPSLPLSLGQAKTAAGPVLGEHPGTLPSSSASTDRSPPESSPA